MFLFRSLRLLALSVLATGFLQATPLVVPNPVTLTPGFALRVPFTTNPGTWVGTPPDFLDLLLGGDGQFVPPAPHSSVINRLYDGNTLLGVYSYPISTVRGSFTGKNFGGRWKSATSLNLADATVIDFTSILDGTINGSIEVLVLSGSLTLDTTGYGPSLSLLRSDATGGAGGSVAWLTAGDVTLAEIPEPGTASLFTLGALGLAAPGLRRFRRRSAGREATAKTIPLATVSAI